MFYPAAHEPHTSIYSALCTVNANYTAHAVKQNTGLYRCFSCGLPNSTTSNTRPTKAAIIPPAPRRTLDRSTHPPYYNRVYKGAAVCSLLWIYTRRCNTLQTMPARRRFRRFPRLALAWHASGIMLSSWHGSAEPLTATAALFSGFRPIANKGEQ